MGCLSSPNFQVMPQINKLVPMIFPTYLTGCVVNILRREITGLKRKYVILVDIVGFLFIRSMLLSRF